MQDTSIPTPIPPVPPPPSSRNQSRTKSRWWIPLAVIGGLLVLLIVVIGVVMSVFVASISDFGGSKAAKPIKKKTVLVVDLSQGVGEYDQPDPFSFSMNKNTTDLLDILNALHDAKSDEKIEGILIKAGGSVGATKLAEIREAVVDFKTSGKFVYAFMESATRQQYYLASVADSIFMPQEGIVEFNAVGATGLFFKQLSDKIGVAWHVEQFEEYKSAAEMTSRENWSAPAKQEVREILESRQQQFVDAVSKGRNLDATEVLRLMNQGVYVADTLLHYKLIDGFSREDELTERIARRLDKADTSLHPKLRTTSINSYAARERDTDEEISKDHGIAIVYASGAISGGKGDYGDGIHSRSLIKNLRKAAENKDVEAILLRIDSPGGSAIASDDIWSVIKEIRKTKPVYASMSDVAASGGYYIAVACDTIVAHPSTITGSIGVIMAIPNVSGTLGKVGITTDTISLGASSHFMNGSLPFSERDKAQLRDFGSGIYHRFVQKVADARKKDFESTRALARGRVWTGQAAKEHGLIDVTGGFRDALALVKKRLGADPNKKVRVFVYPEKQEFIEIILKMFNIGKSDDDEVLTSNNHTITSILSKAVAPGMPVEQFWQTLPEGVRKQVAHTAAMADIGNTEHAMVMMPYLIEE